MGEERNEVSMTEKQWNRLWAFAQTIEESVSEMQEFFTQDPKYEFISGMVGGLNALNEEVKYLLQTSLEVKGIEDEET